MKTIFIALLLCAYGCQMSNPLNEDKPPPERVLLAQEIRYKVAHKLMLEHGLIPCGTGGGGGEKVAFLALSFDYRKPLTIEEGRNLIVLATHELLDAVNADERIRPYLASYPFGPDRTEIAIYIQDAKGAAVPKTEATVFSCSKGTCRYYVYPPNEERLKVLSQETWAEAEQKIHSKQSSNPA